MNHKNEISILSGNYSQNQTHHIQVTSSSSRGPKKTWEELRRGSRQRGGEKHSDVQDSYVTLQADSEYFLLPRSGPGHRQPPADKGPLHGRQNKIKSAADYINLSL